MGKYVDADILYKLAEESPTNPFHCSNANLDDLWELIEDALYTTDDVRKVKHGKWVDERNIIEYHCSECGAEAPNDGYDKGANYCYNCGARMDGDAECNS